MPLDSGCLGERPPRPASKTAKDRSNSAALLASRARTHTQQGAAGRGSCCSSEKDSGYSDTGSDSLQTDLEDQRSVSQPKLHKVSGVQSVSDQGKHILVSAAPELTPIFIIKNVVLKSGQEHVPLSWRSEEGNPQPPTHIVLLQQPGLSTPPLHLPAQRPKSTTGKKSKNTYLPILNSYPRIAPHPSKKTPEKPSASRGSSAGEHSLSKRVCTEEKREKREKVSTSTQAGKKHLKPQAHLLSGPRARGLGAPPSHQRRTPRSPCIPPPHSLGSPSVSSSETPSPPSSVPPPPSSGRCLQRSVLDSIPAGGALPASAKHRRFLNTVEILSQSGLLDITLRTQELLRQSNATEQDVAQLRQHALLLCQAAQAGAQAPAAWAQLHQAMAESGCYPSLRGGVVLPSGEDGPPVAEASNANPDIFAPCGYRVNGDEVAPPSPLFAPSCSPCAAEGTASAGATFQGSDRGHSACYSLLEEILMPPDSSTVM